MGMKKITSLRTAFWRFLVKLLAGLLGAVLIPYGVMILSVISGVATYADYSEKQVKEIAPIVAATPSLSEVQLPVGVRFVVLDKNCKIINTTLEGTELEQAVTYAKTGVSNKSQNKQYQFVTRENEYVVLQYYIGSQFTNEWMNKHLPSPDILLMILMGSNCIAVCIFCTTRFVRNLRLQLTPLFEATSEVAKQNLDFEVGHSKIKEFEEVLVSFNHMKDSLRISLEQHWKAEQMQREQMAALAHDLKTPLTVIQGNADLISETELDEEQAIYAQYIMSSSEQMQLYIRTLIDISRAVAGYQIHMEKIDLSNYLKQIETQIDALCRAREINMQMTMTDLPESLIADKLLLERAIMNVLNNALDYSPRNGTIYVVVTSDTDSLVISVTDEGCGFSNEDLLHAQEQFYMADRSRGSEMHFGMGLYITKSILGQHKGELILGNSEKTGGANVIIKLPKKSEEKVDE